MTALIDSQRCRLAEVAAQRISDVLAEPPADSTEQLIGWREQSLSKGAIGIAVLHGIRAQHERGEIDRVHAWLTRVAQEQLSAGPGVGLWFGAPAVAFALLVATPEHYGRAAAQLDAAIRNLVNVRLAAANERINAADRPALAEFDLVHGLTGLGAYLLRSAPRSDLTGRILSYLVRLTRPLRANDEAGPTAPGWWAHDAPSPQVAHQFPGGHGNFGVAHGIAGPLALLALALRQGITVPGQSEAIGTVCEWLDTWRHETSTGPWWPVHISLAELRAGRPVHWALARPSWCYGTPGLARAQQLAGIALADTARQNDAEHALHQCLADQEQLSRLTESTLCHGWAGLTATVWSAAADAATTDLSAHLPGLVDALLDHAGRWGLAQPSGLINGSAGVALTLHSIATGVTRGWESCLLLN